MRRNEESLPVRREQRGLTPWSDLNSPTSGSLFSASPWQMMRRMQEDMDRIFGQFFQPGTQQLEQARQGWQPSLDVSETDREWLIEADLPGVDRENVDVQVHNDHLILRAETRREHEERPEGHGSQQGQQQDQQRRYYRRERQYGYFERVLPLPENADEENIRCDFKNGVLTVHVPKAQQAQTRGRRIPIGEGAAQQPQSGTAGATGQERQAAAAGAKGGEAASPKASRKQ